MFGNFLGKMLADHVIDNYIKDTVDEPDVGSVLYCDLALSTVEHSGIYVGDNSIVHLDGSGSIEIVSPDVFLNRLGGFNTASSIYVSCIGKWSVGDFSAAHRAKSKIGSSRSYNLVFDNCHQFVSGCLTGNFENADNFLWMLKETAEKVMYADQWRVWKR